MLLAVDFANDSCRFIANEADVSARLSDSLAMEFNSCY